MILGIEGTAWNLGFTIFDPVSKQIIFQKNYEHVPIEGGLDSKICFKHHLVHVKILIDAIKPYSKKLTAVGYSAGPGFGSCLNLVYFVAKNYAKLLNIPLIPVNHGLAHLEIIKYLNNCTAAVYCGLFISGGNTQILKVDRQNVKILAETTDIAVGNLFDKFARSKNLSHPGGPKIAKLAEGRKYEVFEAYLQGTDFGFSGLLAEAKRSKAPLKSVAKGLILAAFGAVVESLERLMLLYKLDELVVAGGVAQNKYLRTMLSKLCKYRKWRFYFYDGRYNGDNATMIAIAAYESMKNNRILDMTYNPNLLIDANNYKKY